MSGEPRPSVAAVVLAARGGARLARTLASVAWAGERLVVDPARQLAGAALPPGVARLDRPDEVSGRTRAPWLLLLTEDEVAPAALAAAVRAATAHPRGDAYRITREVHGFGAVVAVAGAPVRLARRERARVGVGAGLTPVLRVPPGWRKRLEVPLMANVGDALADAVENLDADATALAGLLRAARRTPLVRTAAWATLVGGARVLVGRRRPTGARGVPWARWSLAVLAGYRAMAAYGKLWETLQADAAALR